MEKDEKEKIEKDFIKYDFFNETGLSFDPPESNSTKIQQAIENTKKNYQKYLQNEEMSHKFNWICDIIKNLNKIDLEKFANEKKEEVTKDLRDTLNFAADNMKKSGVRSLVISKKSINEQAKKFRLSKGTVEEIYKECGYEIRTLANKEIDFIENNQFKRIHEDLDKLSNLKKMSQNKDQLVDLYSFLGWLNNESDTKSYKGLPHEKLKKIAEKSYTVSNDDIGKFAKEITSTAIKSVFNSKENKDLYDKFALYMSPEMKQLRNQMKILTKEELNRRSVAEGIIGKIENIFDRDTAVALFCQETGVEYVPSIDDYRILCAHCENYSIFSSFDEAKTENKCKNCGEALYRECDNCGKYVAMIKSSCPYCGHDSASAAKFGEYISRAEQALRKGNFETARSELRNAKDANPNRIHETVELEKKIENEWKKYNEPIQKINNLMICKRYEEASRYLTQVVKDYPQLNISGFTEKIGKELSECKKLFDESKRKSNSERIEVCVDILNLCADYKSAVEFLRVNPPAPCTSLAAVPDNLNGSVSISWKSSEKGISFKLLRKKGDKPSENEFDGNVIFDGRTDTFYKDENLTPGEKYTYTVFVQRGGVYSEARFVTVAALQTVSNVKYTQENNVIHITWLKPNNCKSVTVIRTLNGVDKIISSDAQNEVDDKTAEYNQDYIYHIYANYILGKSESIDVNIRPTVIIDAFGINCGQNKNGITTLRWDISKSGVEIKIFVNDKVYQQTTSDAKFCQLDLPKNGVFKVFAQAFSGGEWINSKNTVQINTYDACEIDPESIEITERAGVGQNQSQIVIKFSIKEPLKSDVKGLHFFVKKKNVLSSPAPWVTLDNFKSVSGGVRVPRNTYMENQKIVCSPDEKVGDEEAYYITLFAVYDIDGKETLSAPCMQKINRPLNAHIFWKVSKPLFGGMPKLLLETKAGRPFSRRPELILCVSDGTFLSSQNDNSAIELAVIEEKDFTEPVNIKKEAFDIDISKIHIGKGKNLFLFKKDNHEKEFTLHWADGFKGRL